MSVFEPAVNSRRGNLIKVIGVGGGGSNAVNHMFRHGIEGVDFYICNTDLQALHSSPIPNRLQLGAQLTEGLGAGSMPDMGEKAAMENMQQIRQIMEDNTKMIFITAGMGGGTGTGAAPVIAKIAKELSILTVGIVTLPFEDEGPQRIGQANEGLEKLRPHVDALLTICNDRIVDMYGDLTITQAFSKADDILCTAAKGIAEIITKPGQINVDFMDVQTAMRDSGRAIMGTGFATGENRAENAVRMALDSPLLDNTRIRGAQHLLVNFAYGHKEPVMSEISKVKKFLQEEAGHTAHLKMGITKDESLGEEIAITVIATGFEVKTQFESTVPQTQAAPQPVIAHNPYNQNPPASNNGMGYQGNNSPYGQTTNPYGVNQQTASKVVQPNLFNTPPAQPSVVNHVPSAFDQDSQDELGKTVHQNSDWDQSEALNPINVSPKAFEPSADEWNEDPMSQIFRDTRMENGRRDRESLLDNDIEIPAYMRRGINLEAAPPSQSQLVSKITIGEEDPMNARDLTVKPNRHLHDNVD
ncbi:MAG: cell division protein FtsZ [Bacteroidota bacterium]|jgi:cell division protein FtsZ|nr:cell division protein FtsZ [Bacteroidota bacterium]